MQDSVWALGWSAWELLQISGGKLPGTRSWGLTMMHSVLTVAEMPMNPSILLHMETCILVN